MQRLGKSLNGFSSSFQETTPSAPARSPQTYHPIRKIKPLSLSSATLALPNIFWCGPLKGSPTGFVPLLVTFLIQNSSSSSVGLGDVVFNGIGSQGNITKITHKFTNSLLEHGIPHQKCHNRKISIPQSKKNISPILPERPIEHLNPHLLPYASF